jgi:hypothetical protein
MDRCLSSFDRRAGPGLIGHQLGRGAPDAFLPIRGGTLMLVEPEPATLVALANSADPTMLVSRKVNEGLLTYGFDLGPQPQLPKLRARQAPGRLAFFTGGSSGDGRLLRHGLDRRIHTQDIF